MKIIILGQGAIGSLLAGTCQQQQQDYAVITKTGSCQPVELNSLDGETHCFTPAQFLPQHLQGDELLVLPLKAFQIETAVRQLKPYLSAQTLLLLNNGMGVSEQVQKLVPQNPLIAGISKKAVYKKGTQVFETAKGDTELGWITMPGSLSTQATEKLLNTLLTPCQWHQDLLPALWQKLAINAAINPLTALYNIKNGELTQPEYQSKIHHLCEETKALMQLKAIAGWQDIEASVSKVITSTANNYSSMHQDVAHKRRTEIDYINGYLVQQGQQEGLEMATHNKLWQRIKRLEQVASQG